MAGGRPLSGHKLPGPGGFDWVDVETVSTRHPHSYERPTTGGQGGALWRKYKGWKASR